MPFKTFSRPIDDRYYEDYELDGIYELGSVTVTQAEIIEFAERFDPQPFHTDLKLAEHSIYGGVIASGWHTGSMMMRLLVDGFHSSASSLGSPGTDKMRWPVPVRGGDELSGRVTVLEKRLSKSKPDRGIMKTLVELLNQNGELVMEMQATNFVRVRAVGGTNNLRPLLGDIE